MRDKISKQRWQQIQLILDEVLDLDPSQRKAYLSSISDQQLCSEVEALLDAERNAPTFLEQSAESLANELFTEAQVNSDNESPIGKCIGAYVLREEIGRGGMGYVYRAERRDGQFDQQVAIKILAATDHSETHNAVMLDRFHQEQQTLASLNHPNIAQLYDGGFTDNNQAYIVMEYVEGEDINRYCRLNELDLEARLELIIQVANVLAFAHKNLIIHRDIKPSNILINAAGQVKLLDFGIAKLISDDLSSQLTKTGESVMTPGFAAPEQIKKLAITVATDIYQLALVMYELITGSKAFSDKADSLYELAKVMCEQPPTSPSQIVAISNENQPQKSVQWQRKLSGDLDAITLKALRTEPEHRYVSMLEFINDIKAHLSGQVVEARQKNLRYLLYNYSRRHWKLMLVVCSFTITILAYAITVTLQSQQISKALAQSELEAEKAQQVSDFMADIFKTSDPNVSGLQQITAQQLLEKGQQDVQQKLQNAPHIRAHMLRVLGDIYYSQGVFEQSEKLYTLALEQQQQLSPQNSLDMATTLTKLAISYSTQNQYQQAESLLLKSLSIYESEESQKSFIAYAEALNAYADILKTRGQYQQAEQQFQTAIQVMKSHGDKQNELAMAYNGLAGVQHVQGQFDLAIENMREGLRLLGVVHGEQHSYYTIALNNLVTILTDLEYFEEATELSKKSLQIQTSMLGEDHPNIGNTLRSLGILSHRQGNFESAKNYLTKALLNKRQTLKQDNVTVGVILLFLGAVLQDMGEFDQASQHYQTMLDIFRKYQVADRILGRGLCQPASLSLARGDWSTAKDQYSAALSLLPEEGVRTAIAQLGFAYAAYFLQSDFSLAENYAKKALQTRQQKYPLGHSLISEAQAVVGLINFKMSNMSEAMQLLKAANEVLNQRQMYLQKQGQDQLLIQIKQSIEQLEAAQ